MSINPYKRLAERLDALPNGFPPTAEGLELRILAKLFTEEEASLAAELRLTPETPAQIAARLGGDPAALRQVLKGMYRRGLITAGPAEAGGLGFKLLPFVVGIYEMQVSRMDVELAALFEDYFKAGFKRFLSVEPSVHRVVPVNESIKTGLAVRPFESAAQLVSNAKAWGVIDCICRVQKRLIGEGCEHPVDVCMTLSSQPGAFDQSTVVHALSLEEALATLRRAAEAGLVHSVSNYQKDVWYICNCCTCSCGILRGMADLGLASVIAHSGYVNTVDEERCMLCGDCVDHCPFDALELGIQLKIDELRCAGCGVCTLFCPEEALSLVERPGAETPPETERAWLEERARARHIEIRDVL